MRLVCSTNDDCVGNKTCKGDQCMEHLKYPLCDIDQDCKKVNRREVCGNDSICVIPPTG